MIKKLLMTAGALLFLLSSPAQAQDSLLVVENSTIARNKVESTFEDGYFSIGAGVGEVEFKDLISEARIYSKYFVASHDHYSMVFSMANTIRIQTSKSNPIHRPSYEPRLMMNFWTGSPEGLFPYLSLGLGHHSNGQSGEFLNSDGTPNTDTGSFSSNYAEVYLSLFPARVEDSPGIPGVDLAWFQVGLRRVMDFGKSDDLTEVNYGLDRLMGSTQVTAQGSFFSNWFAKVVSESKVRLDWSWILDSEYMGYESTDANRLSYLIFYSFKPKWFDEFGMFVSYYNGQDYYNMDFADRFHQVRFGITGNTAKAWFAN